MSLGRYKVICCGSNGSGQLGLGHCNDVSEMTASSTLYFPSAPVTIACGGNHTLVLCEDGTLYASGAVPVSMLCQTPSPVGSFQKVAFNGIQSFTHVACGWEFSVLATSDRRMFVVGVGFQGELGLGKETLTTDVPVVLPTTFDVAKIKNIHCSIHSTIVELVCGETWGWGHNKKGQLLSHGGDKSLKMLWAPTKLPSNHVHALAMAREFTVYQTDSWVFVGTDKFGITPQVNSLPYDGRIFAMWSSLHVWDSANNNVKSLGNNSHGQSFPQTGSNNAEMLSMFAVGSEHGLCYSEDNRSVYAWGWGEHGNCGLREGETNISNVTYDTLNRVYRVLPNERVLALFGGCATSWVVTEIQ